MATSNPVQGQIPAMCDLCENNTNIKWKCLNCDVLMCDKCKNKIHPKMKTTRNHKVVALKEVGQQPEELDFGAINCQKHADQFSCMYCKSCDILVCPLCIHTDHVGHELIPIQDGYQAHVERIKDGLKFTDKNMDKLMNVERKIQEIRNTEHKKYTETIEGILVQNADLKKAVDQYTEKIMKEVGKRWEAIKKNTEKQEKEAFSLKDKLTHCKNNMEEILNSKDTAKFFKDCHEHENYQTELEPIEVKIDSMPRFVSGNITEDNIGYLQEVPSTITINMIQQFTTDLDHVLYLATTSNDSVWIGSNKDLKQVKPEKSGQIVVSSYKITMNSMAVTAGNNLLLAIDGESTLKQIDGQNGIPTDTVYKVDPLYPTAVHVTQDGKVLCGAKSPGQLFPVSGKRVLIKMKGNGAHEKVFEYHKDNPFEYLFSVVGSITSTRKNTIFVVDIVSEVGKGRVVVIGKDGDVIDIYTGNLDINTKKQPFTPWRVVTSQSDNVIISDPFVNTLHILNNMGQPISYCRTSEMSLLYPVCMCFTVSKQLYIGCLSEAENGANLYKVEIFGV